MEKPDTLPLTPSEQARIRPLLQSMAAHKRAFEQAQATLQMLIDTIAERAGLTEPVALASDLKSLVVRAHANEGK